MLQSQYPQVAEFLQYIKFEKRYAQHTLISYQNDLEQFSTYLTQYDSPAIEHITTFQVRSWLAELKGVEKLSAKSINRKISTLRSFFKYLMKTGALKQSPVTSITAPKNSKRLPVFVKESDIENLFDHISFPDNWTGKTDRLLLSLFYNTGMR